MTLQIIYTILEYFLVFSFLGFSFLGWCVEVAYQAVSKGLVVNRGFLNGPVCPIYGFGVLAVFFLLQITGDGEFYEQNALKVFIFGVVLATAVELFGGWILDKAFHARWWDYSDRVGLFGQAFQSERIYLSPVQHHLGHVRSACCTRGISDAEQHP